MTEPLVEPCRQRRPCRSDRARAAHRKLGTIEKDGVTGPNLRREVGNAAPGLQLILGRSGSCDVLPGRDVEALAKSPATLLPGDFVGSATLRDLGSSARMCEVTRCGAQYVRLAIVIQFGAVIAGRAKDADAN